MIPTIHWNLISLEVYLSFILALLIVMDILIPKNSKNWIGSLSFAGLLGLFLLWLQQYQLWGQTFGGMFIVDSLAWFFKGFFLLAMFFVFVMTHQFFRSMGQRRDEFYLLLWSSLLGMLLVASSADFLLLFISIEILTLSLYVMTAYLKSDKHSIEAGMKYLILGALASGLFLYGISFVYGASHSTRFAEIQKFVMASPQDPMLLFGFILIFSAVGFKIASVPFHLWVPDVYQGAPTPVTALLSVGSKAAGFVILLRLLWIVFAPLHQQWAVALAILSAVTMCYGNLAAIPQKNIKRLLGFSSIGHAGYLLMGAAAGSTLGGGAISFYLLGYLFTNLCAFLVIVLYFAAAKSDEIADYSGLSQRSPILACALFLALMSLAGIPPLAGFFGKFTLFVATVQSGFIWLAFVGAANVIISLYYYLMVVKKIYMDPPVSAYPISVSWPVRLTLWFAMAGIIGIGIFQGPFLDAALAAVKGMF
ncbi:MAG: NADH-quinone oxidoreductase subunit N [Candidatus Omnitrophica bacterium]|nr:NADH-quinone oxidoreductase subunit N [Candidatus Omnitrophota bacterium]